MLPRVTPRLLLVVRQRTKFPVLQLRALNNDASKERGTNEKNSPKSYDLNVSNLKTSNSWIGAFLAAWFLRFRAPQKGVKQLKPLCDFNNQTRMLPDGSRVCAYLQKDELYKTVYPDVTTLYEAVRRGARLSNNGPMLGYRQFQPDGTEPYQWLNYDQVLDRSVNLAYAFRELGLPVGPGTCVGVYSKNRPEWIIAEQASYAFSNALVPLYDTTGPDACSFIINQAEIALVIVDSLDKATSLLSQHARCSCLKYIVACCDSIPVEELEEACSLGVQLMTFKELERIGHKSAKQLPLLPPKPEDLATICYTSGTTGTPKGVMLTHGNIIADGTTLDFFKNVHVDVKVGTLCGDVMMSFLPLAHMFERVVQSVIFTEGGRVGFFRGDIRLLPDDIETLQPTVLPVVPRVLNRIYDKVMSEVGKSKLKKAVFKAALSIKQRDVDKGIIRSDSLVDRLIFKKIRDRMGGRVKLMFTGSAPLSDNVLNFTRCVLGCTVVEGYGQTECVACATVTLEGDGVPGHVGVPVPCCKIKLVDVPELNYLTKDHAGEVCIKGENLFKGYYKDETQTKDAMDEDGWLHTGDIGKWTERGTLRIVDRKKHIFKLAQGEYVAPEKIENVYARSKNVAQSFVHGEGLQTCLVAIVVPDPEVLPSEASRRLGLSGISMEELCKRPDVKIMVLADMHRIGKDAGLFNFEQVKDIYLHCEQFSVENGLLTPTLKTKRPQLRTHFQPQIEEMYKGLN